MARSPVTYSQLVALLGKQTDDPAVAKLLAKTAHTIKSDFIIGKDAGFDFSLDRPEGAKKKVLSALFLHAAGPKQKPYSGHLPKGAMFGTRDQVLAALGAPHTTWKIGKGKVPVTTRDVDHDTWIVDGHDLSANYRRDMTVGHFLVSPVRSATGSDLSTNPLHFETRPVDAPPQAELLGMALLVAWAADRHGLPPKHAGSKAGTQLLAREISPRTFLVQACAKKLSTLDFVPELHEFLYEYMHHVRDDEGARDKVNPKIAKLLGLEDPQRRAYTDDFVATFAGVLDSAFHVPDSWAAVDRLAPVIDARLADFTATGFLKAPDVKLYEKAASARDKQKVTAERATTTVTAAAADDTLADALVGLIGRSLKDPEVKAVITRAGMPIGKKIDQQANPALGVAYMGTNMQIDGKKQLGVDGVYFFAAKQKSYIRGIGAEVEFAGYPAKLPHGLAFGDARAAVAKKLGKPESTYEHNDFWTTREGYRLRCEFAKGKLVELSIVIKHVY